MKRFAPAAARAAAPARLVERLAANEIQAAPPKPVPAGAILLDRVADAVGAEGPKAALGVDASWLHELVVLLSVLVEIVASIVKRIPGLGRASRALALVATSLERLRASTSRADTAASLREAALTPESVRDLAPRPGFRITRPGDAVPMASGLGADSPQAARFRQAAIELHTRLQARPDPRPPRLPLRVPEVQAALVGGVDPRVTVPKRALSKVRIAARVDRTADPIEPILAAPRFDRPMYEPLRDISSELLLPNVGTIPQNTIALLSTNQAFVEAYMVGVNHEMSRELLWREYPTDQRGTCFRQFWDVKDAAAPRLDIEPIHAWRRSADLGANRGGSTGAPRDHLVLLVRGDVLKKYPTAVIYAVEAVWSAGKRALGTNEKQALFHGEMPPDITFVGFDLQPAQARGAATPSLGHPGWFFVIKQRPGEPRFGLDEVEGTAPPAARWSDLSWAHLGAAPGAHIDVAAPPRANVPAANNPEGARWGANSADMAFILYQDPVLIAVHASQMLPT
jgi:hypothetical protein